MKENSERVAACVLDVIALVPAVGQAVGLSAKFGKGLALGLNSGVRIAGRKGIKSSARALAERIKLPTTAELASLGKNTLRSMDPGLELVAGFSKTLGNSVVKLLSGENKNAALVNKIASSVQLNRLPEILKDEIQMLKLSHTEVKVPTVKISEIHGEPVYVRVNPETGERYGRRYIKNEPGELIELSNRAEKVKYPETRVKGLERWRSFDHEELTLKEVTSHHSGFSTTLDSSGKIT
ncbi:hypothetical protein SAMN05216516_11326 [Izhakiella capsodis]|uniref:Uncharacterized protein n=1 Tax=Izhakiella capsodis TaxID=1367852 RepID=A0A1I5AU11_9GAMM|nr:hypothetical protein [Izhakiella capsodis]SFN65927.1 hypothetical protein SAMN05216516_11326 [Izhakiella capsodis]